VFVTIKIPVQSNFPVLKEWFLSKISYRKKTAREEENSCILYSPFEGTFRLGGWHQQLSYPVTAQNCSRRELQRKNDSFSLEVGIKALAFLAPPTQAEQLPPYSLLVFLLCVFKRKV
jgi:hypothetical protein